MITDLKHIFLVGEELTDDYREAGIEVDYKAVTKDIQALGTAVIKRVTDDTVKLTTESFNKARETGTNDTSFSMNGLTKKDRRELMDLITEYYITTNPGNEAALVFAGHQFGHVMLDLSQFIDKVIREVSETVLRDLSTQAGLIGEPTVSMGEAEFKAYQERKSIRKGGNINPLDIN